MASDDDFENPPPRASEKNKLEDPSPPSGGRVKRLAHKKTKYPTPSVRRAMADSGRKRNVVSFMVLHCLSSLFYLVYLDFDICYRFVICVSLILCFFWVIVFMLLQGFEYVRRIVSIVNVG